MKKYDEALSEIVVECKKEFARGKLQYGDTWKEAGLVTHIHTAVNDAIKLKGLNVQDTKLVKHRITDIINYLVFVWAELPTGSD